MQGAFPHGTADPMQERRLREAVDRPELGQQACKAGTGQEQSLQTRMTTARIPPAQQPKRVGLSQFPSTFQRPQSILQQREGTGKLTADEPNRSKITNASPEMLL